MLIEIQRNADPGTNMKENPHIFQPKVTKNKEGKFWFFAIRTKKSCQDKDASTKTCHLSLHAFKEKQVLTFYKVNVTNYVDRGGYISEGCIISPLLWEVHEIKDPKPLSSPQTQSGLIWIQLFGTFGSGWEVIHNSTLRSWSTNLR